MGPASASTWSVLQCGVCSGFPGSLIPKDLSGTGGVLSRYLGDGPGSGP